MTSYTIEEHVQMIKLYYKNECSLVQTLRALRPHFGRRSGPSRSTIQRLVAKFEKTGSVANQPALVRQRNARSAANIAAVRESLQANPRISIPRLAQELGLSQTSIWRILRQDVGVQMCKFQMQEEQKADDQKQPRLSASATIEPRPTSANQVEKSKEVQNKPQSSTAPQQKTTVSATTNAGEKEVDHTKNNTRLIPQPQELEKDGSNKA